MKPFIEKVDLTKYSRSWKKRLCECKVQCQTVVSVTIVDQGFIMCDGDAKKSLYDLMGILGVNHGAEWTKADEQFIIQHYEEKGMYKGFNNFIAATLNKTYQQAKNKTMTMQRNGMLNGTGTYKTYHKWTDEQTDYLINHIKEKGYYRNMRKNVADQLGLLESQVKHRIDYLIKNERL